MNTSVVTVHPLKTRKSVIHPRLEVNYTWVDEINVIANPLKKGASPDELGALYLNIAFKKPYSEHMCYNGIYFFLIF